MLRFLDRVLPDTKTIDRLMDLVCVIFAAGGALLIFAIGLAATAGVLAWLFR